MQYRPRLPAGLLAKTGLDLQPQQKLHQHAELSRQLAEAAQIVSELGFIGAGVNFTHAARPRA